jgi:protease-4
LGALMLLFVGGTGLALIGATMAGSTALGPRVGLITVSGPIADQGAGGLFGGRSGGTRDFVENLTRAADDPNIKAVVIRVNSPGGSAAASQEMFQAVRRLAAKKPVYCSMGDVAASGGYYIAAGCDKIYANPSTVTGSIGVISQFMNYEGLFKKVGLDEATIKSGRFKDAGNPARQLTAEERELFQSMIMSIYNQFVTDIVAGRKAATNGKLTRQKLLKLADGRVYTGAQAKNSLLVDELGGLYDAVQAAAEAGGISGQPEISELGEGGLLGGLVGAQSNDSNDLVTQVGESAGRSFGAAFVKGAMQQLQSDSSTAAPQLK